MFVFVQEGVFCCWLQGRAVIHIVRRVRRQSERRRGDEMRLRKAGLEPGKDDMACGLFFVGGSPDAMRWLLVLVALNTTMTLIL